MKNRTLHHFGRYATKEEAEKVAETAFYNLFASEKGEIHFEKT